MLSARRSVLRAMMLCVVCVGAIGSTALAGVSGSNPELDASGGKLYIPLTTEGSGQLGDPAASGGTVGVTQEKLTLLQGQDTEGAISILLNYNLTGQVAPDQEITADSASLVFQVEDLDFRPIQVNGFEVQEWITLSLVPGASGEGGVTANALAGGDSEFLLDRYNYGEYRDGGYGFTTNDTPSTYTLNLVDDLGVTADQLAAIRRDRELSVLVTINARVARVGTGTGTYKGDVEHLTSSFEFAAVDSMLLAWLEASNTPQSGSLGGGTSVPGGIGFLFPSVSVAGLLSSQFVMAPVVDMPGVLGNLQAEAMGLATGDGLPDIDFKTAMVNGEAQGWALSFDGQFTEPAELTLAYMQPDEHRYFEESELALFQAIGGEWVPLGGLVNTSANTITVTVDQLGPVVLGYVPEPTALAVLALAAPVALLRRRKRR